MKKVTSICLIFFIVLTFFTGTAFAAPEYDGPMSPYAALLMDADSKTILYEKNIDEVIEPASTTKILTCIIALESADPEDVVEVSDKAANAGGSKLGLYAHEKVIVKDLINGMMMVSGNDAAIAIAEHIGGSVSDFADMMNAKAQEIGMENSSFCNPHGMHTENGDHHSTARDMATLTLYALKNPEFVKLVKQKSYDMPKTNKQKARTKDNTNKLLIPGQEYYYSNAAGIKTGSTPYAGDCLVSSASSNDMNLICLVFKDETKNGSGRWKTSKSLFDYGFENYKTVDISSLLNSAPTVQAQVEGYALDDPSEGLLEFKRPDTGNAYVTLEKSEVEALQSGSIEAVPEYINEGNLKAPINEGDILGTVTYKNKATGEIIFTDNLIASRDVPEEGATGKTAVATLPPKTSEEVKDSEEGGAVWLLLIIPAALIVFLIIRMTTTSRSKRFKKRRRPHYSYRIK